MGYLYQGCYDNSFHIEFLKDHTKPLEGKEDWISVLLRDQIRANVQKTYPIAYKSKGASIYLGNLIAIKERNATGHFDHVFAIRMTFDLTEEKDYLEQSEVWKEGLQKIIIDTDNDLLSLKLFKRKSSEVFPKLIARFAAVAEGMDDKERTAQSTERAIEDSNARSGSVTFC